MNFIINDTAWMDDAPGRADIRPVGHPSSQINAGPQYVADVLGRFGADSTDMHDAAPVVLGYN